MVIAVCIHRLRGHIYALQGHNLHGHIYELHGHYLQTDTTLDIDDEQAKVRKYSNPSAHSPLRSMFGDFAEQASRTGYEPIEQFDEITPHNFASIQGGSGMSSISSSSTCSSDRSSRDDDPRFCFS